MAARNGLVLAGNNEDRNHPETLVNFFPATDRFFGRIVFGYDDAPFQGGMNDQGLFIDGNALAPTGWQPVPGKPMFRGIVIMVVLGTCATCEDVKDFFEEYNVPGLERARFPIADRTGTSMVVEYGRGAVRFVETIIVVVPDRVNRRGSAKGTEIRICPELKVHPALLSRLSAVRVDIVSHQDKQVRLLGFDSSPNHLLAGTS